MNDIDNILIKDSKGDLSSDLLKIYKEKASINSFLEVSEDLKKQVLKVSMSNIRFSSIPNLATSSYKIFLTYNGTLGLNKKIFSRVVSKKSGVFNALTPPVIEYNPSSISELSQEDLQETVLDIKMYNGQIDVLQYSEGKLHDGEKSYFVKSRRAFPTQINSSPNIHGKKVYLDGWYSYTGVIFRDVLKGASVYKESIYSYKGFIFKADRDGIFNVDNNDNCVINVGETSHPQSENDSYEDILFSLNESSDIGAQSNSLFTHSHILITDEIRDAITKEVINAAFDTSSDFVKFQNWQKLSLKRMSAAIMFENGLFESAQILLESSRSFCVSDGINFKNSCI